LLVLVEATDALPIEITDAFASAPSAGAWNAGEGIAASMIGCAASTIAVPAAVVGIDTLELELGCTGVVAIAGTFIELIKALAVVTPGGGSAVKAAPASKTICDALDVEVPVVNDRFLPLDVRVLPFVVMAPLRFVLVPNVTLVVVVPAMVGGVGINVDGFAPGLTEPDVGTVPIAIKTLPVAVLPVDEP
jgi:hypothetical protein